MCGRGSICSLGYCLPTGSCPPFSQAGRHRVAPTAVCVRAGEHEHTPLPLRTNSAVIHGEVCAHTPPSGRPQRLLCACPRQHTPHSCVRGWTFKTCPLTPPRAAPMARSGRPDDAEPCCYPLLRKRFSGILLGMWLWSQPCLPTLGTEGGVCPAPGSSSSPGLSTFSTSPGGLEPTQASRGLTNGCSSPTSVPSSPSAEQKRLCAPLCVLGASARLATHGSAGVCFLTPRAPSVLEAGTLPSQAPPSPPSHSPPR